jgi:DNA-binding SARP family transcriptional activator
VLAFHPLPADLEQAILSGAGGPEALFSALAKTMLDAQPAELRHFLLASSTLTRITPELCTTALKLPGSGKFLAQLLARNLFVSKVPGGLVYHMLFRNFLQRQLASLDPALFTDLHIAAAKWFEESDHLEEAFDHYLIAAQIGEAAGIADRMAHAYFAQGKFETLLDWNARLIQANIQLPRLLYRCAIIHTDRYEYDLAADELIQAEGIFRETDDQAGLADVKLQQATLKFQRGDYLNAAEHVADLVLIAPGPGNIRGRALNAQGIAYLQMGDTDHAVQNLEQAMPLYRTYADAYALSQFLQNMGLAYWRLGRANDALASLQEVVALRRSLGGAGSLAAALVNLGYYYGQLSDYKQAIATLQEGLSAIARFPNRRIESYLLLNLGDVKRNQGSFSEAARLYGRTLELLGDGEPSLQCTVLSSLSTLYRWDGNLSESIVLAQQAVALADRLSIHMEGSVARIALIAARAQMERADNTRDLAEALATITQDLRERRENFALLPALALCAQVALQESDTQAAASYLQSAVDLARQIGTTQPLVLEIIRAPRLEQFLNAHHSRYKALLRDVTMVRDLQISQLDAVQVADSDRGATTYSLRILSLGQERVFCDGEPINAISLRRIGRDLFFYLLFVGPDSWEALGLIFWPDSTPRRVRSNFHTTMHRARQILGDNVIVVHDRIYGINPEVEIWCDALEMEKLVQQARLLPARDARTEDLWRRAVNLYRGEFLPSIDAEWAMSRRETLRELYIEALLGLAGCARARSDFRQALDTYKRAADLEPYREDIHQAIMTCYADKGDKQRIVTHLHDLKKVLRRDLDAEPSQKTMDLVKSLLG